MDQGFLLHQLEGIKSQSAFRFTKTLPTQADFCSNDYLGLARSKDLALNTLSRFEEFLNLNKPPYNGSTGSRLISGHSDLTETTESILAKHFQCEAALVFNSGYNLNQSLCSTLGQEGDAYFLDEQCHASINQGVKLSSAATFRFKHNSVEHLTEKLERSRDKFKQVFIIAEALYSMDGDFAPLVELVDTCKRYKAHLILDEAHSVGVYGDQGRGYANVAGLEKEIFARVITFGKAFGTSGAAVLGSQALKDYLINFAKSFIYTTALPPFNLIAIQQSSQLIANASQTTRESLMSNIGLFEQKAKALDLIFIGEGPIRSLIVPENEAVLKLSEQLTKNGFNTVGIRSPTVKKGQERIRITLHSYNGHEEISSLLDNIANYQRSH